MLVSIMHVNNEIGVVQDVGAVGRLCRERGVLFHVDAAQSAGKLPLDVNRDCVDLLALTAHKLHGPKGIGALYVRREPRLGLVPLLHGGGQERGLRSGTLPTHQIVGMGAAYRIAAAEMAADAVRITGLRERLWQGLATLAGVSLNGHPTRRVPGILSVAVDGVEGESLLFALPGLAVSSGSACASHERRAVVRAAGAGTERPPGAELAAPQPRSLQHRRGGGLRDRGDRCGRDSAACHCAGGGRLTGDDPRYGDEVRRRMALLPGAGALAARWT